MRRLVLTAALLSTSFVYAQSPEMASALKPLLDKGPLVQVVEASGGKFGEATVIQYVAAPPDKVYEVIVDQGKFKDFVPKVTTSDVTQVEGKPNEFEARYVLDVPGPDTDYTIHFTKDDAKKELVGAWAQGDLKNSKWHWKVVPAADGNSLVFHTITIKNFSSMLTSLEDDSQTITVGVNVSSALAAVKAVKKRAEGLKSASNK